uniref:RNase H type-1 domain-containing protein n=1 Tax=Aegilops tauschii subsp. strangulata TaxID=200361 RepID=A0A453ANK3_AEGTS
RSRRGGGAVAAVCRDQFGMYLGSSAVVFQGINDPLILETYACREALALADDLAVQTICVASDCQGVVNDINKGTGGPNAAIVHEILTRCESFSSFSFIHERRNFNYEAHNLAKFACNL